MLYRIVYFLLWLPIKLLFPTQLVNKKNIPKGGVVFACNHYTNVDAVLVALSTFRKQRMLGKAELFQKKWLGWLFLRAGIIPIQRGKADLRAIKESIQALKNNQILTVFPEGTRNKNTIEMAELKEGTAMFAIKAQKPILPVLIIRRPRLFRFNKIVFGKPIYLEEFYEQKLTKEVLTSATQMLSQAFDDLRKEYQSK